ncbi:hypothetical protein MBAV_001861 [Candidatus Magnetobacterium bavaricum]|uniref:Uncharacterized protein n=1 Tax=Candidatus Magnetobacterium bavaricum TaxID=29290 RepID=A0A0F3GVM7_9BACT|nr:hypothetical protein MBAV_001861 [Candidatus Magnetobacterium bavaricum]
MWLITLTMSYTDRIRVFSGIKIARIEERKGRLRPPCRGLGGEAPILSLTKPPTTFLCTRAITAY